VSDLQCAATLLVVRHGDHDDRALTALGRSQARTLARDLTGRRVAAVYTSRLARARDTGVEICAVLGLGVQVVDGLEELDLAATCPDRESGAGVVQRFREALDDIADLHRGETVVAVSHPGVMSMCLPVLCRGLSREQGGNRQLAGCTVVEIHVDGDGWMLGS